MKTHLNTLFVTTEGSYLAKDGQAVAVRVERATRLRVPLHNLDGIVCLGRVAKACLDYGQRVQNSVFEMKVDPAQWTAFRGRLLDLIDPGQDSLRFYLLGDDWQRRVEHHGTKPGYDVDGPLIA